MTIADADPKLQARMIAARGDVEANNTDPDTNDPFAEVLTRYANARCEMDAQGDVWTHDDGAWWTDEKKREFLAWLAAISEVRAGS